MQSIESTALEPTKSEMAGLSTGQKIGRLIPVYGLVILTLGLIVIFSILLPDTFPTVLNVRSIVSDLGQRSWFSSQKARSDLGWQSTRTATPAWRGPKSRSARWVAVCRSRRGWRASSR